MSRHFNREKDELLIEAVKAHNVIFDTNHKHFKNNIIKHKSWEQISDVIGVPVEDCKRRWKSLRDQFNRKRKYETNNGGASGRPNKNWEYMTLLSFIPETCLEESKIIKQSPADYECVSEQTFNQDTNDSAGEYGESSAKKQKHLTDDYGHMLQRRDEGGDDELVSYEPLLKPKLKQDKTPLQKFFESMADAVASLPPHIQAEVKLRVCQIVTEAEVKVYALSGACSH